MASPCGVLKWLTLVLVCYLYHSLLWRHDSPLAHNVLFFRQGEEAAKRSTEAVYQNPPHDVYQEYYDKVVLTEEEEDSLIREYSRIDREIKVKPDCAIGVGYTTCMDINFRAVDMFRAIENQEMAEVLRIQKGRLVPQVHERIAELHEFTETFLYYFSQGVNAERVAVRLE